MAEFEISDDRVADEDYWQRFKLRRDPFSRGEEGDYYPILQWQHYFELFEHKILHRKGLLAVIGENESGKTSLIQNFQAHSSNSFALTVTNAHLRLDAKELFEIISTAFNVAVNEIAFGEPRQQFQDLLEELSRYDKHNVLIIDNAHQLMEPVLEIIVRLTQMQSPEKNGLTFILVGEPQLQTYLNKLVQKNNCSNLLQVVIVEPLSHDATLQYIEQSLRRAGSLGKDLLSEDDMERIYKLSQGYIGRINQIARHVLSKMNPKAVKSRSITKANQLRVIGACTLGLFAVAFAWMLSRGEHPSESGMSPIISIAPLSNTPKTVTPVQQTTASLAHNASKIKTQLNEAVLKTDNNSIQKNPDKNSIAHDVVTLEESPVSSKQKLLSTNADAAIEQADEHESNQEATKEANNSEAVIDKVIVIPKISKSSKTIKKNSEITNNEIDVRAKRAKTIAFTNNVPQQKIQHKDAKKYFAIQLLGTSNYGSLKHFIATNALTGKVNYIKGRRNGNDWYVLFYGQYATRHEANADIIKLSANLKKLNPWVKTCDNGKQGTKFS